MDAAGLNRFADIVRLLESVQAWDEISVDPTGRWQIDEGSVLAIDDAAADPYGVSHRCWLSLVIALDHLRSLRRSVIVARDDASITGQLGLNSQFTLARGLLENAASALWLLAPADRSKRIERRLRFEWSEIDLLEETRKLALR